ADDDCRLLRRPGLPLLDDVKLAPLFSARSQSEGELGSVSEGEGGEKKNGEAGEAHGGPSANGGGRVEEGPICPAAGVDGTPPPGLSKWPGRDSTPHALRHRLLSPAWLPVTPPGRLPPVYRTSLGPSSVRGEA